MFNYRNFKPLVNIIPTIIMVKVIKATAKAELRGIFITSQTLCAKLARLASLFSDK